MSQSGLPIRAGLSLPLACTLLLSACEREPQRPVPAVRPLGPRTVAPPDKPVLSAGQALEAARPAIVVVESLDRKRRVLEQGSGVVIGKNIVVTPWSLVSRASAIRIHHDDVVRTAALDAVLERQGLARLETEVAGPIAMARDAYPSPGTTLYAASSTPGVEVTLSEGIAAGVGEGKDRVTDLIQTTVPFADGLIGGALLNLQGELIGIVDSARAGDPGSQALPVRYVKDLLALPPGTLPRATSSPLRRLRAADRKWLVNFMAGVAREGTDLGVGDLERVNALLDRIEPLVGAELAWAKVELGLGWLSHQRVFWEDAVEALAFRRVVKSKRREALEKSLLSLRVMSLRDIADRDRIMRAIAAREPFETPGARIVANDRWLAQMLGETDRIRTRMEKELWEARNR